MNGDEGDPAFRCPRYSLFHSLPNVEHLGVEKDVLLFGEQVIEQAIEAGGELQPQAELGERNHPLQLVDQHPSLAYARHVKRDDQAIFRFRRHFATFGHRSHCDLCSGACSATRHRYQLATVRYGFHRKP